MFSILEITRYSILRFSVSLNTDLYPTLEIDMAEVPKVLVVSFSRSGNTQKV